MKRAIRHLAVFALLGVVMNYAVAWGLEVATGAVDMTMVHSTMTLPTWRQRRDSGVFTFNSPRFDQWHSRSLIGVSGTMVAWLPDGSLLPFTPADPPWWASPANATFVAAQGFPVRSVRWYEDEQGPLANCVLIWIGSFEHPFGYKPIWPGLLFNSAFYGAILWLLWFGPGISRRRSRRRRGLCVSCGYDLRGSAAGAGAKCPECGG
jgi:hypothetical protein